MLKSLRYKLSVWIKLVTAACAITGALLSMGAGSDRFMAGNNAILYFTIQSNLWIAAVCLIGMVMILIDHRPGQRWMTAKLVFTVSITLTGFVFCFVLAPTLGMRAWNLTMILTHVVVPVTAITDLLMVGGDRWQKRDSIWVAIPPLYYVIFAGIGYVQGWDFGGGMNYPYFFLNWGSPAGAFGFCDGLPFMGVFWWIMVLLLFIIGVALLYIRWMKRLAPRKD